MTVWVKEGVAGDLQTVAQKGFGRVVRYYEMHGLDTYRTSIREGNHMGGSLHYIGLAFDIKRQKRTKKQILAILGSGWQVIEYSDMDIFHCEYDP